MNRNDTRVSGMSVQDNEKSIAGNNYSPLSWSRGDFDSKQWKTGCFPGEALLNQDNRALAAEFVAALFSDEKEEREVACPLCGGQTFRFTGGSDVQCMLCSHSGTISMSDGKPDFRMRVADDIVLSRDAAAGHGQWLKGMKKGFQVSKSELKQVRDLYRNDGTWIQPPAA